MKKRFVIVLFLVMALCFSSCVQDDSHEQKQDNKTAPRILTESAEVGTEAITTEQTENMSQEETSSLPLTETTVAAKSNAISSIKIGDVIETDSFKFTLENVSFAYEITPSETNDYYHFYNAESGKVFIRVDATYYNRSKRNVYIRELPAPSATYNDGYKYDGFSVVEDGNDFESRSSNLACAPLTACHYVGIIECPDEVETSDDPLIVKLKINHKLYQYSVR